MRTILLNEASKDCLVNRKRESQICRSYGSLDKKMKEKMDFNNKGMIFGEN
jgi:hypothetical protein